MSTHPTQRTTILMMVIAALVDTVAIWLWSWTPYWMGYAGFLWTCLMGPTLVGVPLILRDGKRFHGGLTRLDGEAIWILESLICLAELAFLVFSYLSVRVFSPANFLIFPPVLAWGWFIFLFVDYLFNLLVVPVILMTNIVWKGRRSELCMNKLNVIGSVIGFLWFVRSLLVTHLFFTQPSIILP